MTPRLRIQGALQWHGGPDPAFVETCCCAQADSRCGIDLRTRQIVNLQCGATRLYRRNAVCRVACLAWIGWIGELMHPLLRPEKRGVIPLKPCLQKRLRDARTAVEIT